MNTREVRQAEAMDAYISSSRRSIINACPRFGKIKTSIGIMQSLWAEPPRVLVVYPRTDIREGWVNDFNFWGYHPQVTFTTYRSLDKEEKKGWDLIIYDELHEASEAQLRVINTMDHAIPALGLTGTMTMKTEDQIYQLTGITVCYGYSIEEGVEDGVLCDYDIFIHHTPLDNSLLLQKTAKGRSITEKKAFENLSYVTSQLEKKGKSPFFLNLKKIALIQGSYAKRLYTENLIAEHKGKRILVFCGTQEMADSLGIPSYHSANKDKALFRDFCEGRGDLLATVKMMQAGVTIRPIDLGILNYTSGNPEDSAQKICRFLGFEYQNPQKKARIHIVCSTEKFETERIQTALKFFNPEKIHLLNAPKEKQNTNQRTGISGKRFF